MLNNIHYDYTIPFIFRFCWFGVLWRRYFVDFSDNYLFYPLEMVENWLIRAWQGSLNDFKGIIRLSPTQQHHLRSSFNNLNALREKYSLIFTINSIFTPWMNRKCLISAQISIKKDPVWLKSREYHQNQLFKSKKWVRSFSYWIILMILVKKACLTPWFETKVVIPEIVPGYQLPFLDFSDAQYGS